MNYDNIIYPLDKIYSAAVGTTYPVCGAGHDGPIPPPEPVVDTSEYLNIKNISNETGVFKIVANGSPTTKNLDYSFDKTNWTSYDFTNLPEVEVESGEIIYFRGNNNSGFNWHSYENNQNVFWSFNFSKNHNISGNLFSLQNNDPQVFSTLVFQSKKQNGKGLFYGDTYLIESNMNFGAATTISGGDYYNNGLVLCFRDCVNLVKVNNFEIFTEIIQGGLDSTFYGCTSLQSVNLGSVSVVGLNGLKSTFLNCSNLTSAPDLSNVLTVENFGLYNCFYGCSNLTKGPDLSNVTSVGDHGFDSCFYGCSNLTTGPDFSKVTSVGEKGLYGCFFDCSKISTVTAPNISDLTANSVLMNWLNRAGTQATGTKTVLVPTGATIATNSVNGIPDGWTRIDY